MKILLIKWILKLKKNFENCNFKINLIDLCNNWLKKSGLNKLKAFWECENGLIKKFTIKQSPCLEHFNNLQTHLFEILLLYNEDQNKNLVKKIIVLPKEENEIKELENLPEPKGIILNYNDWAYFKWIVDEKTIDYLKNDIIKKLPDELSRKLFFNSLYDLANDALISCQKYLDYMIHFLEDENHDEIITNCLLKIYNVIEEKINIKLYKQYSNKIYDLLKQLIFKYQGDENNDLNILFIEYLIYFSTEEEQILLLKHWLEINEPYIIYNNNKIILNKKLLLQNFRFNICVLIYELPSIKIEEKEIILNKEIEKDNKSDRAMRVKCKCKSALPDLKIKEEIWDKIFNHPNEDSLYNQEAYISSFVRKNQLNLIKNFSEFKFFEDILKLKNMDFFFIRTVVNSCGLVYFCNEDNIKKLEKIIEECKNYDVLFKALMKLLDKMKQIKKCQDLI